MKNIFPTLLLCFYLSVFTLLFPPRTLAQSVDYTKSHYQTVSFTNKQKIVGTSTRIELSALDIHWKHGGSEKQPFLIGKEFKIIAHEDLAGAKCSMTRATSDANGRFQATCSASVPGRFVFHVEPAFPDFPRSSEYEIHFVTSTADIKDEEIASDKPTYTVTEITTDKGACSSGFSSGTNFTSCNDGKGYTSNTVTCRNGYTVRITYSSCLGNNEDEFTNIVYDKICGNPRCGKAEPSSALKASVTPKPITTPSPLVASTSAAGATPAASTVVTPMPTPSLIPESSPSPGGQDRRGHTLGIIALSSIPIVLLCAAGYVFIKKKST